MGIIWNLNLGVGGENIAISQKVADEKETELPVSLVVKPVGNFRE